MFSFGDVLIVTITVPVLLTMGILGNIARQKQNDSHKS